MKIVLETFPFCFCKIIQLTSEAANVLVTDAIYYTENVEAWWDGVAKPTCIMLTAAAALHCVL